MTGRLRPRIVRSVVALAALVASGGALAACGASAGDLARTSCAHVNQSLALLNRADHVTDPAEAQKIRAQAYIDLLAAIPIAAQAAYHDIQWESLSATLSEANRVPESQLVPSLQAQCHNADSSVFDQLPPPSSPSGGTGS